MILRKAFSLVLLALFLFNVVGYFITFKLVQYQVKKEVKIAMKQRISISELTAIQINKRDLSQLVWKEKNKEFYYKGELYDIVKTEEQTESVTYYCINDEQEEKLFANLDDHIKTYVVLNKTNEKNSQKKNNNPLVKLYFVPPVRLLTSIESKLLQHLNLSFSLISLFKEIDSPPPQLV